MDLYKNGLGNYPEVVFFILLGLILLGFAAELFIIISWALKEGIATLVTTNNIANGGTDG